MPRRRSPRSRRGRCWLLVATVTAVGVIAIYSYKAVSGGGRSDVHAADAPKYVVAGEPGGKARGWRNGGLDNSKGNGEVGADPFRRGDAADGGVHPAERRARPPATGNAGSAFKETEDGGFTLKVGQVTVKVSESLDFSTEEAVPGSLWLPTGLNDVATGDPLVTMCLIDYKHYQDSPSTTPMFTHLGTFSKCGIKRKDGSEISAGMVEVVRMSSLLKSIQEQGRAPLPPKGFVYHETRCGSTLVANMLAALPPSRVFSESKPPTQVLRECMAAECDRSMMLKVFRDVVGLMGRRRRGDQHDHLYFKFQNSKFLPEISEAYPEVPWVFVFRDPVEVMVSNLKSFAGAPCVRIPRQEQFRKSGGKLRDPLLRNRRGEGAGGGAPGGKARAPGGKAGAPVKKASGKQLQGRGLPGGKPPLDAQKREKEKYLRGKGGGLGAGASRTRGGGESRMLAETWDAVHDRIGRSAVAGTRAAARGNVGSSLTETDSVVAVWEEEEEEEEEEEPEWQRFSEHFGSVSWNGYASGDVHSLDVSWSGFTSAGSDSSRLAPSALGFEFGAEEERRSLAKSKRPTLDMNMTMECADWLKSLCIYALDAEKKTPSNALFVDYANLPDAVPEFIFPEHFGMVAEVAETVPNWKDIMFQAAGVYSKGMGKTITREFANDVEAKHNQASPLIVQASEMGGGLYEIYHSLEAMQTWRRPESEDADANDAGT